MPLKSGKKNISANIAELIRAGHDPKQAEAIAYHVANKSKSKNAAATTAPGGANSSPAALLGDDENENKWHFIRSVPVFDAHDGAEEGLDIQFTPEILNRIIEQNNKRIEESGDLIPVTKGHTGGPEEPPILGWASNFTLGKFGKDKRACIFCDMKFTKENYQQVKQMSAGMPLPRRSIELWDDYAVDPIALTDKPILDSIALLSERPARNLGLGQKNLARKYTYSLREEHMNPDDLKQIIDALQSLPEFQYLQECMANKTKLSEEEAKEDEEDDKLKADAEGDEPEAMEKEDDEQEDEDQPDPAKLRCQRDQIKRRFAKAQAEWTNKLDAIQAENKTLFSKVEALERDKRVAQRKADLMQLEAEGFVFDMADELEMIADYEPTKFAKHVSVIKKNYKKAPVNVNVKVANIPAEGGFPTTNPQEVMKAAALKASERYQKERK